MKLRIALARLLIRAGNFMQSSSLMVMRPDDLVEFSRQTYAREKNVAGWSSPELLGEGLYPEEKDLLHKLPFTGGSLLLLGLGGGREAIPLARQGFKVTGVDFVPEMVEQAKQNAAACGLKIEGLVQDISRLEAEEGAFDAAWLSTAMYSSVPTRQRRIAMLRCIYKALRPGGYLVCQFHWGTDNTYSPRLERARKALAWLTRGHKAYEPGDMLLHNIEFIRGFLSAEELKDEFEAGGFEIVHLNIIEQRALGSAMLKRSDGGRAE